MPLHASPCLPKSSQHPRDTPAAGRTGDRKEARLWDDVAAGRSSSSATFTRSNISPLA